MWPERRANPNYCFRAMMVLQPLISISTIWPRPNTTFPWRRVYAPSTGSTRKRLWCCLFSTSRGWRLEMSAHSDLVPLQPGDRAPNLVLDAITQEGKIALDDFRGQRPVLV